MISEMRHTIILELPKVELPGKEHLKEFILHQIETGAAKVDFFGGETDHSFEDDIPYEHNHHFQSCQYVSFHFKAFLDTATDKESAMELLKLLLTEREILDVKEDKMDVDVYI